MIPVNILSLGWRVNWPSIPSSGPPEGGRYRIAFFEPEILDETRQPQVWATEKGARFGKRPLQRREQPRREGPFGQTQGKRAPPLQNQLGVSGARASSRRRRRSSLPVPR